MAEIRLGSIDSFSCTQRGDGNIPSTFCSQRDQHEQQQQHSNSLPITLNRSHRSERIPISMRRSSSEAEIDRVEAEADYQDYIFFSRIVDGITNKQSQFQDGRIIHENELTLLNMMRTRHEEDPYGHDQHPRYPDFELTVGGDATTPGHKLSYSFATTSTKAYDSFSSGLSSLYAPFPEYDPAEEEDASESGVFDMEL